MTHQPMWACRSPSTGLCGSPSRSACARGAQVDGRDPNRVGRSNVARMSADRASSANGLARRGLPPPSMTCTSWRTKLLNVGPQAQPPARPGLAKRRPRPTRVVCRPSPAAVGQVGQRVGARLPARCGQGPQLAEGQRGAEQGDEQTGGGEFACGRGEGGAASGHQDGEGGESGQRRCHRVVLPSGSAGVSRSG